LKKHQKHPPEHQKIDRNTKNDSRIPKVKKALKNLVFIRKNMVFIKKTTVFFATLLAFFWFFAVLEGLGWFLRAWLFFCWSFRFLVLQPGFWWF